MVESLALREHARYAERTSSGRIWRQIHQTRSGSSMTQAHKGMDATGDEALLEEGEQLGIVTVEIPKNLQVRAWKAKLLKGMKIKDLVRKGLENELKRLGM